MLDFAESYADPISPQSLVDQIDEYGEPWGLCADFDPEMGRVFVCEVEPKPEVNGGLGDCSYEGAGRRLCSVDDAHPLTAVFGNRIGHGEVDPRERFKKFDELVNAAKQRESEAMAHEWKSTMRRIWTRGGAMFYPGMLEGSQLNRKERRKREAIRRRLGLE